MATTPVTGINYQSYFGIWKVAEQVVLTWHIHILGCCEYNIAFFFSFQVGNIGTFYFNSREYSLLVVGVLLFPHIHGLHFID